eukprot:9541602-Ditylum_brightwellii.AAC.1
MHIVREHKCPGTDNLSYSNMCQNMDNWFTSKSLFDELIQLEQNIYDTMERKWYVPPFITNRKTKKSTLTVPKGMMNAGHSKGGKLSIWSYMDSSLLFILGTCWDGLTEPFVHRDKENGERKFECVQ